MAVAAGARPRLGEAFWLACVRRTVADRRRAGRARVCALPPGRRAPPAARAARRLRARRRGPAAGRAGATGYRPRSLVVFTSPSCPVCAQIVPGLACARPRPRACCRPRPGGRRPGPGAAPRVRRPRARRTPSTSEATGACAPRAPSTRWSSSRAWSSPAALASGKEPSGMRPDGAGQGLHGALRPPARGGTYPARLPRPGGRGRGGCRLRAAGGGRSRAGHG